MPATKPTKTAPPPVGPIRVKLAAGEKPGVTCGTGGVVLSVAAHSKVAASGVSAQGGWRLCSTSDVPVGLGAGQKSVQACLSSVRESGMPFHLVFVREAPLPSSSPPPVDEEAVAVLQAKLDAILDSPPVAPPGMEYQRDVSTICDWLLLGNIQFAKRLLKGEAPDSDVGCVHLSAIHDPYDPTERRTDEALAAAGVSVFAGFWSSDNEDYDIVADYFASGRAVLSEARRTGERIFVHCLQGFNRSAAICAAFLVEHEGMALTEAAALLHHRRGGVLGNKSFRRQLVHLALRCGRGW